jgi:hypothetical protein
LARLGLAANKSDAESRAVRKRIAVILTNASLKDKGANPEAVRHLLLEIS